MIETTNHQYCLCSFTSINTLTNMKYTQFEIDKNSIWHILSVGKPPLVKLYKWQATKETWNKIKIRWRIFTLDLQFYNFYKINKKWFINFSLACRKLKLWGLINYLSLKAKLSKFVLTLIMQLIICYKLIQLF